MSDCRPKAGRMQSPEAIAAKNTAVEAAAGAASDPQAPLRPNSPSPNLSPHSGERDQVSACAAKTGLGW